MGEQNNEKDKKLTKFIGKASETGKKVVENIQKGAKNFSEQRKKAQEEKRIQKYKPLFPELFKSADFRIPNVIRIVDDAERRDVDVCDGAIGWLETVEGVEVLVIYDEYIADSGVQFIPFAKCDSTYCVDPFERNKFIDTDTAFERTTNEKIAELEHIAYCLGAKNCSIEIVISNEQSVSTAKSGKISGGNVDVENTEKTAVSQRATNITHFAGTTSFQQPTLKWFAYDENMKGLIDMRCSGNNSIKSKLLELHCSASATMSQKIASAIDKIKKINIKSKFSAVKKATKEQNSLLVFSVEF